MKTKLIEAIRETIIDLETGRREYSWSEASTCNCGILTRNISNLTYKQLRDMIEESDMNICDNSALWSNKITCTVTNAPLQEVFKKMYEVGLTKEDIIHLERLSDSKILSLTNIDISQGDYYMRKENVLLYFRAWLRILEREETPAPKLEPEYRFIKKHESVEVLLETKLQLS